MARIRTIKPEFFTSDDICALSPLARLLYVGLWCEADRDGRLVWTPGVMKRRYLPDDACDIEVLGAELVGRGLIRLYGDGLACIPSFARHQHVNIREAQSKLPPPPGEVQAQLPLGREGEGKEREGEGTGDGGAHAHVLPQDWKPDDGDLAWAATARPDLDGTALDAESERFRNHAAANRRTAHRWGPAWRIWISKAHPPKAAPVAAGGLSGDGPPERDTEAQWRARLARYRPGKFWLEGDWGPRPESGHARVPPNLLADWRRQSEAA